MIIIELVFWLCAFLVFYTYVGYMLVLSVLPSTKSSTVEVSEPEQRPSVTMIIAAFNEESFIRAKIENALAVEYPETSYKVIVVSDGSDDSTNAIAREFKDERLTFLALPERGGKANALNQALKIVDTEFVVFTDANVFLESDAVSKLTGMLSDPKVGAVTGLVALESIEEKEPLGEGAYMRYERHIQSQESKFWSVAGVDGALFAVRRDLVMEIPSDTVLDDFTIGVNVALAGYRICYQPEARAVEQVPAEVSQEFRRKTRISAGCFQMLSRVNWDVFGKSPLRFRFSFFSHKVVRWYAPFLLLLILVTNILLAGRLLYDVMLLAQIIFYALAIAAHLIPALRQVTLSYIAYYFSAMNLALIVGWYRHRREQQSVTWNRVDR